MKLLEELEKTRYYFKRFGNSIFLNDKFLDHIKIIVTDEENLDIDLLPDKVDNPTNSTCGLVDSMGIQRMMDFRNSFDQSITSKNNDSYSYYVNYQRFETCQLISREEKIDKAFIPCVLSIDLIEINFFNNYTVGKVENKQFLAMKRRRSMFNNEFYFLLLYKDEENLLRYLSKITDSKPVPYN